MNEKVNIIGIDPAPSKNSTVFDGNKFHDYDVCGLLEYINNLEGNVLLCWDAPLLVPKPKGKQDLYTRPIEAFFRTLGLPNGISVLGYAGCPHWTVSQYVLGYPEIGKMKLNNNTDQYKLIKPSNQEKYVNMKGKYVVEVHPALALYLWFEYGEYKFQTPSDGWKYKGNVYKYPKIKSNLCDHISKIVGLTKKLSISVSAIPEDDDQLDAYIAWLLGELWLSQQNSASDIIKLIGDDDGYFLLPDVKIHNNELLSEVYYDPLKSSQPKIIK